MCTVSMVTDHYKNQWNLSGRIISEGEWQEYQRLKRNAEEIDKLTKQPDCVKPDLQEWEQKVIEVLKKQGLIK